MSFLSLPPHRPAVWPMESRQIARYRSPTCSDDPSTLQYSTVCLPGEWKSVCVCISSSVLWHLLVCRSSCTFETPTSGYTLTTFYIFNTINTFCSQKKVLSQWCSAAVYLKTDKHTLWVFLLLWCSSSLSALTSHPLDSASGPFQWKAQVYKTPVESQ